MQPDYEWYEDYPKEPIGGGNPYYQHSCLIQAGVESGMNAGIDKCIPTWYK